MDTNYLCIASFLLMTNPVCGISQVASSICLPSISIDKKFPEVGEDVKVVAKYCPENENNTFLWRKCGELIGTCVKRSCTKGVNIKNDPSNLQSTLTIRNASITNDNCHVTFIADGGEFPKRINIYKHPEFLIMNSNVDNETEIHLHGEQFVCMNVEISCMFPRPTLNVVYKDDTQKERLLRSNVTIDGIDRECKPLEVSTFASFNISAKEFEEAHLQNRGILTARLVYGEITRTIFNRKITFDKKDDETQGKQTSATVVYIAVIGGLLISTLYLHFLIYRMGKKKKAIHTSNRNTNSEDERTMTRERCLSSSLSYDINNHSVRDNRIGTKRQAIPTENRTTNSDDERVPLIDERSDNFHHSRSANERTQSVSLPCGWCYHSVDNISK